MVATLKRYLFVFRWVFNNKKDAYYVLEDAAIREESAILMARYKEQQTRDCN